jgi:hypothetical protein
MTSQDFLGHDETDPPRDAKPTSRILFVSPVRLEMTTSQLTRPDITFTCEFQAMRGLCR